MKAIITKYALTSGVRVEEGAITSHSKTTFTYISPTGFHWYVHGSGWHKDKGAAERRVLEMRQKKQASLERQLAALGAKAEKALKAIEAAEL